MVTHHVNPMWHIASLSSFEIAQIPRKKPKNMFACGWRRHSPYVAIDFTVDTANPLSNGFHRDSRLDLCGSSAAAPMIRLRGARPENETVRATSAYLDGASRSSGTAPG